MAKPAPQEEEGEGESRAERLLLPFVREPMLWPILIVAMLHVVAFVTPVAVIAVRDRAPFPQAALLAVVLLAGAGIRAEVRKRGRPGPLTGILSVIAALTVAASFVASRHGFF